MQQQQSKQIPSSCLRARIFDFVDLHPSRIQHMSFNTTSNKLYVGRKQYSEVFEVTPSENVKLVSIEQIMVFQACEQIYEIDGLIVILLPFEMKVNFYGKWAVYPFTTQLLPQNTKLVEQQNKLYTFHTNQCRQWSISEDDGVFIRHLSKFETPYHITVDGAFEGFGKKIKPNNFKDNKFTVLQQSQCGKYIFVGSDRGHLHIYETKYLTHIKTFHRHQASILSIIAHDNICYFTGSDSKISSIINTLQQGSDSNWVLSREVRGQSHDIFSIQMIQMGINCKYLISGGVTTDICFYKLSQFGILGQVFSHKVSYSSEKLVHFLKGFLVVNKHSGFEIWKIGKCVDVSKCGVELVVKYQMPFYKWIRQILVKQSKKSMVIFVSTQQQANLWQFDEEIGLTKLLTVKNNYNVVMWYKKQNLVTIRDGNLLQMFNYKTGQIRQICQVKVGYPTDVIICQQKQSRILVGSKYSKQIQIYKMNNERVGKVIGRFHLSQPYNILNFCYFNYENLMIKLSSEQVIKEYNRKGVIISDIVKIPVGKIRDMGWLQYITKRRKAKNYWYGVSEGKIVIVSQMGKDSKRGRKVRVKQMPRIGSVFSHGIKTFEQRKLENQHESWNLGVIPLNFGRVMGEEIQPIITKKIL